MKTVKRFGFNHLMVVTSLGFLMSVVFFLLDEFKSGNAVHTINYAMIVWIWLGLVNAAVKTLRVEIMAAATKNASSNNIATQPISTGVRLSRYHSDR